MESGLILLACGLVGLAIAVNLFLRPHGKSQRKPRWVTRDLYRGDLHALADLVRGPAFEVTYDQIGRLKDRGFVRKNFFGTFSVTLKGYVALILKMTVARDHGALAEKHRSGP